MISEISSWLVSITAMALISAVAMALTPDAKVKRVTQLVCGLAMLTVMLKPLLNLTLGTEGMAAWLVEYKAASEMYGDMLTDENAALERAIIESEAAAYISDKGRAIGITDISATVTAKLGEDGYYYPYSAELSGTAGEETKKELNRLAEANLGIAGDRIEWSEGG